MMFVAPEREWSIYSIFDEVADRLGGTVVKSTALPKALRYAETPVVHFQDFDGFMTDLWDDIRDYTYVWASGMNYRRVPWDRIPNVIAQSSFMASELHPVESTICRAGVDTDVFYPDGHGEGLLVVGNKRHPKWLDYGDLDVTWHDGWNDTYVSQDELREIYNDHEALVHLSSFDGGGMPLLEAAACGLKVISTAVGYAPSLDGVEIVRDWTEVDEALERAEPMKLNSRWTWNEVITQWERVLG